MTPDAALFHVHVTATLPLCHAQVFMRVEEMGRDDTASPDKVANEIFTRARQNVSELLRGESVKEEETERPGNKRSRAVQIRDHFNRG